MSSCVFSCDMTNMVNYRYWLKYLKHNLQSGERWSRFEKVHKRDAARHSRWSPNHTTRLRYYLSDFCQTAKMWSYTRNVHSHNLTFQEKFLTTCLAALKFPWRTFQPAGYVLSAKLTYFFTKDNYFLVNKTLSITRWVVGGIWRSLRRRSRRREEKSISPWPSGFEKFLQVLNWVSDLGKEIYSVMQFKGPYKNPQWRETIQLHPMWQKLH